MAGAAGDPARQKGGTLPIGHMHSNPPPAVGLHVPPLRHGFVAQAVPACEAGAAVVVVVVVVIVVVGADLVVVAGAASGTQRLLSSAWKPGAH